MGIPTVHVEAGLRSFDRTMPEEINRVLTDQLADLLYTTERSAARHLAQEGVAEERVRFVGNVMIDSMLSHRPRAVAPATTLQAAGVDPALSRAPTGFALVTLHRPSNVDGEPALAECLAIVDEVARRMPVIWPVHPRTRANMRRFGLSLAEAPARVALLEPLGYLEMLGLMAAARVVLTDSGGVQEETTALGVPCLTLRDNTERPVTVEHGTNEVIGRDRRRVRDALDALAAGRGKAGRRPELWDGQAATRIAGDLADWLVARARLEEVGA